MMKLTFLGTGTSCGVPFPRCKCEVCQSSDPHDNRLRTSALIETSEGKNILIDCGPDFRQQALRADIDHIDALLITHVHFDHCAGLDDLRAYTVQSSLPMYADQIVTNAVRRNLDYIFVHRYPGVPQIDLHTITSSDVITVGSQQIIPLQIFHGQLPIMGYRMGRLAYVTDCTCIPDDEWQKLNGIDTLVLDALRWKEHRTHWNVTQALEAIRRIHPRVTYFTHLSHDIGLHRKTWVIAPGVFVAHDGLTIEIPD